ncbi:DUF6518 family protein [Modestobacter sp. URMC 112]
MPTRDATRARTPLREGALVVGLALLGAVAGAAAKAADESGTGWLAQLGSDPAAWVLAVALIGRSAPGWPAAGTRSAAFFAAMTVAYYSWAAVVLGFGWSSRLLAGWLLLSATAVPLVGVGVHEATRRSGAVPGALLALAAGIALAGGAVVRQWVAWTGLLPGAAARPVQAAVDVGVALVLVLLLPRRPATRLWAPALVLPMAWLAARLLDVLRSVLG